MGLLRTRPVNGKSKRRRRLNFSSVLDDKLIETFCSLILRGLPPDGCCDYLGIHNTTFWQWKKKGSIYLDGDGKPDEYEIYGQFLLEFRRASAEYRLGLLERMHKSSQWAREMTILERRDRKSFSRNEPQGGTIEDYQPDDRFL